MNVPMPQQVAVPPEQQIAQAGAALNEATAPAYPGGTPEGALTSTPRQGAADLLNSGERQKGLEGAEGEAKSAQAAAEAAVYDRKAAESAQLASDQQRLTAESLAEHNQKAMQDQAAYDKFKASAGTLKDPEAQFYEDKGQGYRVQTALASFAAGIGAGWNGQQNPVIDLLQKKIQANYESHKQNIEDLYKSSVQAGRIVDTTDNHAKFRQDALLTTSNLQNAHFKDELSAVAARAQSPLAKLAAQKTIEQIDQNQTAVRQKLAQQEAAGAAAGLAAQRARAAEVRAAYQKALEKHADLSPEDARMEATKDLHSIGFNASETAPIFEANGVQTDPRTGAPVFPEAKAPTGPSEPTYDADGKLRVPSHDATTGKQLKPEERQKIAEDTRERTVSIDGKPRIAVSKEAAKTFAVVQSELPNAERMIKTLNESFAAGDKGTYDRARQNLIEVLPKLYGFTRAPSEGQTGGGGAVHEGGDPSGTLAAQIPEFHPSLLGNYSQTVAGFNNRHSLGGNTPVAVAQAKLKGLADSIGHIKEDAYKATFPTTQTERKQETIAKTPVAELAAGLGLKPVQPPTAAR